VREQRSDGRNGFPFLPCRVEKKLPSHSVSRDRKTEMAFQFHPLDLKKKTCKTISLYLYPISRDRTKNGFPFPPCGVYLELNKMALHSVSRDQKKEMDFPVPPLGLEKKTFPPKNIK
jgi:hypothetical protein